MKRQEGGENCVMAIFITYTLGQIEFEKRPLGRPRRRWDDNVKPDIRERERMGWYGLD
jgi:hypothetical protein